MPLPSRDNKPISGVYPTLAHGSDGVHVEEAVGENGLASVIAFDSPELRLGAGWIVKFPT